MSDLLKQCIATEQKPVALHNQRFSRRLLTWLAALCIALLPALPTGHALAAPPADVATLASSGQTIPVDQLGLAADKQAAAGHSSIVTTPAGVTIRADFQDLAGRLTADGLWLHSTDDAAFTATPFRVMAQGLGRETGPTQTLPATGAVAVAEEHAQWRRPGVIEEYSATSDGVRQDFLLLQPPAGAGQVRLELAVAGATATNDAAGLRLTLADRGRELVYGQLHVTDATGRVLPAQMRAPTPHQITILVDDHDATWPLRIDPTFSDADWVSMGAFLGTSGPVNALAVSGSDLYVGGSFTSAGSVIINYIAKWNGSVWSPLGTGVNGQVNALAVSGSDLYVGGTFTMAGGGSANRIAKWNGSTWSALGAGVSDAVNTLVASNNVLYVGGAFTSAGTTSARHIAKWNGSTWSTLGTSVSGQVNALAMIGSDLYVGGYFSSAGSVTGTSRIAKWNGSAWSALGTGVNNGVFALAVSGSDLYVGGQFTSAGGVTGINRIAKWDGSAWSALGTGADNGVTALAVSGSDLYVGGYFTSAGGVTGINRIAKWDGSTWSALDAGLDSTVNALAVSGSDLYVGGSFTSAGGGSANQIAKWNGSTWSTLGTAINAGVNSTVYALAVSGSDLYVGGTFSSAGGVTGTGRIAKWNGSAWSALGTGVDSTVIALAVSGSDLYVGGTFSSAGGVTGTSRIAKWNGSAWSALGTGVNGQVSALAVIGSDLYVGGYFPSAGGVTGTGRIAKWDGSVWSALGTGVDDAVTALAVIGSDLYVGGYFPSAGGVTGTGRIAKWDGSVWSALGTGVDNTVFALAVIGSDLYVGGSFTSAGGVTGLNRIAKWDGSAWSALGTGVDTGVTALAVSGSDLYVGGYFTSAGGVTGTNRIAKWDGSAWSALGTGVNSTVTALAVSGSDLYVGGSFTSAGGKVSAYLAKAQLPSLVPEIAVQGNGTIITSGDSTPSSSDHTDFGSMNANSGTVVRTFTVQNSGNGSLTGVAATLSGNAAFSLSSTPAATVSAGGNTTFQVTFTPTTAGTVTATVNIANNDSDENPYTFIVGGTGLNSAPTASNGSATTPEDTAKTITLAATDLNSDALSYTIVSQPEHGTVTVVGNTATYTPTANYNGSDSFTFQANDGAADSNVATVSVTVTPVNDAPTASDGATNADDATATAIALTAGDVDGDALTYTIVSQPSNGAVTVSGATATYTSTTNFSGTVSFTFQANDGLADSNVATVTVTVRNRNDAPVAADSAVTTNEDMRKSITLAASDADGDGVSYTIVGAPVNGAVSVSGNTATYTPTANFNGSDSFTFQASDGQATSNVATVAVTVRSVNDRPTVVSERITMPEDSSDVLIDVLANDADVDGDSLSLLRVGIPSRAGAVRIEGNALRYSPAANFNGTETFTYTVSDGKNGLTNGRVTAVVAAVNDAPNTVVTATVSSNSASFGFSAEDVDSTLFTYQCALDGGAFTTCTSPKAYTGLSVGAHSFQVRARDNRGLADPTPASHSWAVASATLTIVLDAQPNAGVNRTFASPTLPHFWLDDTTDVSDTDAYTNTKRLTVASGVYTFTETALKGWHLRDILCSPGANATIDQATRTVAITVASGENVTCTFTEQLGGTVVVRSFIDRNGNGVKAASEPYTNGVTLHLYSAPGVVAATQSTADLLRGGIVSPGYTSFKNVRPGVYALCLVAPAGWVATRPVTVMADYDNLPCFAPVTVAPGRGVSYLVGNQQAMLTTALSTEPATDDETTAEATAQAELTQLLAAELQTIADEANAEAEGNTPTEEVAFGPNPLFLPLVRSADAVVDVVVDAADKAATTAIAEAPLVTESGAEVSAIVMVSEPTDADVVDGEANRPAPAESGEAETVVNEALLLRLFLPVVQR